MIIIPARLASTRFPEKVIAAPIAKGRTKDEFIGPLVIRPASKAMAEYIFGTKKAMIKATK